MMLAELTLGNRKFVFIFLIIIIGLSIRSFLSMPRAEDPQISLPMYNLFISYPGTSPEDMEELVVHPIEEVINKIDDITEISSNMREGSASIFIEAATSINPDDKYEEILSEVDQVKHLLPAGLTFYNLEKLDPTDQTSIYQYSLSCDSCSYNLLNSYAQKFKKKLGRIRDVRKIQIDACPEEELSITLNIHKMRSSSISMQQVIHVVNAHRLTISGGAIETDKRSFTVSTTGGFKSIEDIKSTVITSFENKLIYLSDIAEVTLGYETPEWVGRYNQNTAIWLTLNIKKGANVLMAANQINEVEANFRDNLPPSVELDIAFEQPTAVKKKIDEIFVSLLQGVVLVGLIVFLFIGWRASTIIIVVIPLSMILGLALLNSSGFALQQVSIAALILALGLLVDNGIVVIESIDHYLKEGLTPKLAAIQGTSDVGYAIFSSTVTSILAFIPLSQVGGGGGEFLKSMPVTVTIMLLISLLLALTLSPLLASNIMKKGNEGRLGFVKRFTENFSSKVYLPLLKLCLKFGWVTIISSIILLGISISLFPKIGVSLLPPADKPIILVDIETPGDANWKSTERAVHFVESILDSIDYVKSFASNIGHSNPQIYYNRPASNYDVRFGQVLVNFEYWDPQEFYQTLSRLRSKFRSYSESKIAVNELKQGLPNAPILYRIFGDNTDTLKHIASQIEDILNQKIGVIDVVNPMSIDKTGIEIELNKDKAGLIGLDYGSFVQAVSASLSGLSLGELTLEDGNDYPLFIRYPFNANPSIEDLNSIYLDTKTGAQVPLRQVANIQFKALRPSILHVNLDRLTIIHAGVENAEQTIGITQQINDELDQLNLPEGYTIVPNGEFADQQELFGNLGIIFLFVLIGIFAVLVLQFRSFLQPIVVLSAIPFAVSGSFLCLYWTGWSFSLFAFIGFISLAGIVVNDSILIVDQINKLRREGMSTSQAILTGSRRRLVPVVLTTLTTVLGLTPLAMSQSNLWSPLCISIIGGMLTATFMILLVVPLLYQYSTWFESREK